MPALEDSLFSRSVMIVCEHNAEGAMGIVINQPLEISTPDLLEQMEIANINTCNANPVYVGGPVQMDRGFVVHRAETLWKSSILLDKNISITSSPDILHAMAREEVNNESFIALGYSGWAAGQLEQEIIQNSWLTIPIDPVIIFDTKVEQRWKKAIQTLGIEPNNISQSIGHA